jgi:hypothetical protein
MFVEFCRKEKFIFQTIWKPDLFVEFRRLYDNTRVTPTFDYQEKKFV